MAKITTTSVLTDYLEVTFLTGSQTGSETHNLISLNSGSGVLSDDGITGQVVYSHIKDIWKSDNNLIKYAFPMISITPEQFEFINNWDLSGSGLSQGNNSKYLVRDAGWALKDQLGASREEWMNITTLGNFDSQTDDQAYFVQSGSVGGLERVQENTQYPGNVNQGVLILATGSLQTAEEFNLTGSFKIYLREQGKTYGFYDLTVEQGLDSLTYRKYALPLSNSPDTKIVTGDGQVGTVSPWNDVTITYYTTPQDRTIGAGTYPFHVIIDNVGQTASAQQIYERVQYELRQTADMDDGAGFVSGSTAEELLEYVGDTLKTKLTSFGGVYIDNFQAVDTNNLVFVDDSGSERTFPFVAAGNINFNDNLVNDAGAFFKVFFTNDDAGDDLGRDFGGDTAILIENNAGDPITASVAGSSSVTFDYDYDGNIQRGSDSSGSIVPYTAVASGLSTAQYVVTTGNITRTVSNVISFVAALERNYLSS